MRIIELCVLPECECAKRYSHRASLFALLCQVEGKSREETEAYHYENHEQLPNQSDLVKGQSETRVY